MNSEYKRNDIEREFGPDLEAVHDLCDAMIQFRERIASLQTAKGLKYGYLQCVLGPDRWKRLSNEVQRVQQQLDFGVLGRIEHVTLQAVVP